MTNIYLAYPSTDQNAVIDIKKGRAQISLTEREIDFLMEIFRVVLDHQDNLQEDTSSSPEVKVVPVFFDNPENVYKVVETA